MRLSIQVVLGLSCLLVVAGCGTDTQHGSVPLRSVKPPAATSSPAPITSTPAAGSSSAIPQSGSPQSTKNKYVPHESEKKFQDFLHNQDDAARVALTDEQVFAVLGEPTRRSTPFTGQKNGQTITVYEVFWEEPGSGIKSSMGFMNGRASGMAIGVKVPK